MVFKAWLVAPEDIEQYRQQQIKMDDNCDPDIDGDQPEM